jgi:hypothetical protein
MKITYTDNPLATKIELDDFEKMKLWYKIKIKEMEELLWDSHFALEEPNVDIAKARKYLDYKYFSGDDNIKDGENSPLEDRVDEMWKLMIQDLKEGYHAGDCTAIPCSCLKCYAEEMIGIDTLKGTTKFMNDKINWAFNYGKSKMTIDEAIKILEIHDCIPNDPENDFWKNQGGYEQFIPQWKEEYKLAAEWLKIYKKEKLNK